MGATHNLPPLIPARAGTRMGARQEGNEVSKIDQFYEMSVVPGQAPKRYTFGKGSTFGGPNDPGDNGDTASGFSTRNHPETFYVALPRLVIAHYSFPWFCDVTVEFKGKQVRGFLADIGPAAFTGRRIDLSPYLMEAVGAETDDLLKFYVDPERIMMTADGVLPGKGS